MLTIMQFETLDQLLRRGGSVLDRYHRRDPGFEAAALSWLSDVEVELGNNRLSLTARVAATRAELAASQVPRGKRADRLTRTVAAVGSVIRLLDTELAPTKTRIAEAAAVTRQTLAVSVGIGVLEAQNPTRTLTPQAAFSLLQQDRNTAGGLVQLAGLVGPHDALVALARSLAEM